MHFLMESLQQSYKVALLPALQIREPKSREVTELPHGKAGVQSKIYLTHKATPSPYVTWPPLLFFRF